MSQPTRQAISSWSNSASKRVFDAGCVLLALPVLAPLALVIAILVRFTSSGPVLFRQKRVGRYGRIFTILKFRTIVHADGMAHQEITTLNNQMFTPVGLVLRRLKLDELPQFFNVLLGHMSMVGPRPKIPQHTLFEPLCRPGLTGMATLAFADEEAMLCRVPEDKLQDYFYNVVLPAKYRMDSDYVARATFGSDAGILVRSVLRRWHRGPQEDSITTVRCESTASALFYVKQTERA